MKITDEALYQHVAEARDIWLDTLPKDDELPEHQFSDEFMASFESMKKQEARLQLQQYSALITSDDDKRKLLIAEADIERDNEYIMAFKNSLGHVPSKEEMQAQQLIQQANAKIQELNAQNLELQKQVNELQLQARINAYSTEQQLILENNKHKNAMEMKMLEARIDGQEEDVKSETELAKAEAEIEQEALKLRQEQLKTVDLENKVFGGMN